MISVVIATYNGEKYLREQLDSIYSQTLLPDEVLAVDDCSSDGTVEILEEYHQKYGLKYYVNEHNIGYDKNFEKAISLSSGEYISISDQDDVWFPEKIETLYTRIRLIENNGPACVSSNIEKTNSDLNVFQKMKRGLDDNGPRLLYTYSSQGCTLMFNRALWDIISPIPKNFIYDAYIGTSSLFIGNRYHISKPLMYYRIHGNNAIGTVPSRNKSLIREAKNLLHILSSEKMRGILFFTKMKYGDILSKESKELLENTITVFSEKRFLEIQKNIIGLNCFSLATRLLALFYFNRHYVYKKLKGE